MYRENIQCFYWQPELYFVNIKNNRMWCLEHAQKKLVKRKNKTENVTSNTILKGSTISSLTSNRLGYQDWVQKELPPKA